MLYKLVNLLSLVLLIKGPSLSELGTTHAYKYLLLANSSEAGSLICMKLCNYNIWTNDG